MAGPNLYLRIVTRAHALSTGEPRTKPVFNQYDFFRTVSGGAPSKTAATTAFKTALLAPLQAVLSVSYVTDYIDFRWLDDPYDAFTTQALAVNGTVTGDSLPSLNTVYLRSNSGFRNYIAHGGKHYGPIAESQTTLDSLTAGAQTLWATFQAAWLAGMTASDGYIYRPVIVSETMSTFTKTTAIVVATPIVSTTLNTVLGKMDRRRESRRSSL